MRLLKDYRRIDQEKKAVSRVSDPSVKIRKKSPSLNKDKTLNVEISDDTEREVLQRIRSIYKSEFIRLDLDERKSPDFIIDKIYEECSRRGKNTNFISIDRRFDKMGFRVSLKYNSGDVENVVVRKTAMKLKVALLLVLEDIIS